MTELVYRVESAQATPVQSIALTDAGLRERTHLQEWVLSHPEMLGDGVMVVTAEFDKWFDKAGQPSPDRLDVLGLGRDGRLVVAELKRDEAPVPTAMQAVNYAARASRFTISTLAECHAAFVRARGEQLSIDEAEARLRAHAESLDDKALLNPSIVLLAASFPQSLTSSIVWLTERGVEISLRQFRAYRTGLGETLVTVSQLFPVPDVEEFMLVPARKQARADQLPETPWTAEELRQLTEQLNLTSITLLELCGEADGNWVAYEDVVAKAGVTPEQARSQMAWLTMTVKSAFGRSNRPVETDYPPDGSTRYRMPDDVLAEWHRAPPPAT